MKSSSLNSNMVNWSPETYDAWYETPLGRLSDRLEKDLVFSLADVKQGQRALDVGCGTGIFSIELAKRGIEVTGIDGSEEMLNWARIKAEKEGLRINFLKTNALALPFPDDHFDLILSVCTLCFVEKPQKALLEIKRVLKPDGRIVIGALNRWSPWALVRRVKGLFMETVYNRAEFISPRELGSSLARAGFKNVKVKTCLFSLPVNCGLYLRYSGAHEWFGKTLIPGTGAFIAAVAAGN